MNRSGYMVRTARRAICAALPIAALLASCDAADPLFEGGDFVDVQNDTNRPMFVIANESGGEYGFETRVPPGDQDELDWPGCKTLTVTLKVPPKDTPAVGLAREKYREVLRDEIEMCPGDRLVIDPERNLTIECGETSRSERAEDCGSD